jgi:cytidylate kinase
MSKKKIITIGGKPGSGKSSTAKKIAEILGYTHHSTGKFFREIATERGVTVTELNFQAETDKGVDEAIDNKSKALNNNSNIVMDSRLAFNFIPDSFKVYLEIDPEVAAKRMFEDMKENEERQKTESTYADVLELEKNAFERYESENKRFKTLYDVNPSIHDHYDLVIDTGAEGNTLESVAEQIMQAYEAWLG